MSRFETLQQKIAQDLSPHLLVLQQQSEQDLLQLDTFHYTDSEQQIMGVIALAATHPEIAGEKKPFDFFYNLILQLLISQENPELFKRVRILIRTALASGDADERVTFS